VNFEGEGIADSEEKEILKRNDRGEGYETAEGLSEKGKKLRIRCRYDGKAEEDLMERGDV